MRTTEVLPSKSGVRSIAIIIDTIYNNHYEIGMQMLRTTLIRNSLALPYVVFSFFFFFSLLCKYIRRKIRDDKSLTNRDVYYIIMYYIITFYISVQTHCGRVTTHERIEVCIVRHVIICFSDEFLTSNRHVIKCSLTVNGVCILNVRSFCLRVNINIYAYPYI